MIFHNVEQNSDEWFDLRLGKPTTSKFGVIMANYGKAFSDTAKKYAFKLAMEQVTGKKSDEENFTNKYMEAGHEYEPVAQREYEMETFNIVSNGGFCQHDKYNVGGSPDGLIWDREYQTYLKNGIYHVDPTKHNINGIEIKSVINWTQRNTIKRNSFDPAYRWQILGNIWLCDLDWLDFISYGYNYTESKKTFIYRAERKEYQDQINLIEPRLLKFLDLIESEKKYI